MRTFRFVTMALALVLILTATVSAAPAPETSSISLTPDEVTLFVGESTTLTATSLKQGSAYSDSWNGASKQGTVLNADGYYISTATFTATTPGTYTISYAITMTAGRDKVVFSGTGTTTITVIDPPKGRSPNCGIGQGQARGHERTSTNPGKGACASGN